MNDAPDRTEPDEAFEVLTSLRLILRSYGLVLLAGALWYLPTASTALGVAAAIAAGLLAFYAWMPLAPASLAIRNSVCRQLGLSGPPAAVLCLGIALFGVLLGLGAAIFLLVGYSYAAA